jgi:hypothetical protein
MVTESHSSRSASLAADEHAADLVSWGVPLRLSARTETLLDRMRQQAPFGSMESSVVSPAARRFTVRSTAEAHYQVVADGELLVEAESLPPALIQLGGHMMIHVAEYAPDFVFIHAGAVVWQNRALILPGVSHAGKSTLVAELVRSGATYYSDEFAILDCHGRVHPFARDLRMRHPGRPDQTPLPLLHLNGRAGEEPLPVAMVVFAEFREHACWTPEPVSPGNAVLEMLLHTAPVQRSPARVLATLTAMMRHATAWRSQRGEAAVAAPSLLAALATGEAPV